MLSVKSVNALAHYTDWIIAHVHTGALGWNGFLTFGMIYWLAPRLFQTKLHSQKLAEAHFWLATFGIILYVMAIYSAGLTQGLDVARVRRDRPPRSTRTSSRPTMRLMPMYWVRGAGRRAVHLRHGALRVQHAPHLEDAAGGVRRAGGRRAAPLRSALRAGRRGQARGRAGALHAAGVAPHAGRGCRSPSRCWWSLAVIVASLFEIIPTFLIRSNVPTIASVKPYTPLELAGRDLYIREGCFNCHSQMIRPAPLRDRALRRVLQARRVRLRPSVPLGLAPHRAGPGARGREVPATSGTCATCDEPRDDRRRKSIMPSYPHC